VARLTMWPRAGARLAPRRNQATMWPRAGARLAPRRHQAIGAVLLAALTACTRGEREAEGGLGRAVATGPVRALRASADGSTLAFLDGCAEVNARFLPPRTANCTLRAVPAAGGDAAKVADAVTTLPHGFGWSGEGATLAALAGYDYPGASGTLVLWGGGAAREVARDVTFHGFVPGALAAIAGGRLVLVRGATAPEVVDGVDGLSTFEFEPQGGATRALLRRGARAGGELLALEDGRVRPLAASTGEYGFAPAGGAFAFTAQGRDGWELRLASGGATRAATAGRQVRSFAFAPAGDALAFLAEARPGEQGNLHVIPTHPEPGSKDATSGGAGTVLAQEVGEYRWAARAPRLAWLERYDPRVRSGVLGAGGPGLAPRTFGKNVSDFAVSPDGAHLAFLQHTTRGGYSVDLGLAHLDGPKDAPPATLARGVFGFSFSPDGRWLYYRTRCTRNGEACDLERMPAGGLAAGATPEAVAQGVKSFEFDPRDPGRLLIGWQRMDLAALDLAVWREGKLTAVDRGVLPGSAQFLGPDSRRVAYAVVAPKREGVYVAEVP
jgi:WD40-like Beta Propeller Repeat